MRITKLVQEGSEVTVTLDDGVIVHLSFHPGRVHLHFSNIGHDHAGDSWLVASACLNSPAASLPLANSLDVGYRPARS